MSRFHSLRVKWVKKETPDTVSFALDIPESLKATFAYTQGQYLTFKKRLNGKELRRSYSLCTSPYSDKHPQVAVKQIPGGQFSTWIHQYLQPGDMLEVMPPAGSFYTPLKEGQKKHYVGIAGGSGITPLMSLIKSTLQVEAESTFTLIYGSRSEELIIFRKALQGLEDQYPGRLKVAHVLSEMAGRDDLHTGLLTPEKLQSLLTHYDALQAQEYFICGPAPVIENSRKVLKAIDVPTFRVHIELFQSPDEKEAPQEKEETDNVHSEIILFLDGEEYHFSLETKGKPILDAAMDIGADVPYSCKGAVCATCRAKVMEGKVKMDKNYALSDQEVKEGFVLTCQSHPLTEKVVVDYDQF